MTLQESASKSINVQENLSTQVPNSYLAFAAILLALAMRLYLFENYYTIKLPISKITPLPNVDCAGRQRNPPSVGGNIPSTFETASSVSFHGLLMGCAA